MCGQSKNIQLLLEQLTKQGLSKAGKQRYKCKGCGKIPIKHYTYQAYTPAIHQQIVMLIKEFLVCNKEALNKPYP